MTQLFSLASGSVVESPSLLAQLIKQYEQYVEMLEKANESVNKLNAINDVMNKTTDLLQKDGLKVANPMEVIENLKNTMESIKYNFERMKKAAQEWDITNNIRNRRLSYKCPMINFDEINPNTTTLGKKSNEGDKENETEDGVNTIGGGNLNQTLAQVLEEFTDIQAADITQLGGTMKGMALALTMCDKLNEAEKIMKTKDFETQEYQALLQNNYAEFKKIQEEKIKYLAKQEMLKQEEMQNKLAPMAVRMTEMMQQLGVTDRTKNGKFGIDSYCKDKGGGCKPQLMELDYIMAKEKDMIEKASKNSNQDKSQSAADREFIMIDYLREIARHMQFLNETMAMTTQVLADEKIRQNGAIKSQLESSDDIKRKQAKMREERIEGNPNAEIMGQVGSKAKLDKNGFPTFNNNNSSGSVSF